MKKNSQTSSVHGGSEGFAKKMTVTLPEKTARMLNLLSELQSVSLNEAVRRAIATEALIQREVQNDSRVIIETVQGETKELVFR